MFFYKDCRKNKKPILSWINHNKKWSFCPLVCMVKFTFPRLLSIPQKLISVELFVSENFSLSLSLCLFFFFNSSTWQIYLNIILDHINCKQSNSVHLWIKWLQNNIMQAIHTFQGLGVPTVLKVFSLITTAAIFAKLINLTHIYSHLTNRDGSWKL